MWTWPRRRRRSTPELPSPEVGQRQEWQEWRPTSPRARTLIVVVAIATAVGVLLAMLQPQLRLQRARSGPAVGPAVGASVPGVGQCGRPGAPGCPGGKLDVIVLPAQPEPHR